MERNKRADALAEENRKLFARIAELEGLLRRRTRERDQLTSIFELAPPRPGTEPMRPLARALAKALGVSHALIGTVMDGCTRVRTLAVWADGEFAPNFDYALKGTPCDDASVKGVRFFARGVRKLFPGDRLLAGTGAESYLAVPLFASDGSVLGIIAALDVKPMEDPDNAGALLKVFAARAGAELERKRAEEALRESTEKYRRVIETANIGVWTVDENLHTTYVNSVMARMLGYKTEEMAGRHVFDFMDEEFRRITAKNMEKRRRGTASQLDFRLKRKDGSSVWTLLSTTPIFESGRFAGAFALARDISRRKEAEEALRRSEASLSNAQRIAHIGNWDWDMAENEVLWSDEIYRIFGVAPREFGAAYGAFISYVHPGDRDLVQRSVDEALRAGRPYSIDHRIALPDGTVKVVHEEGEVIFGEDGRPLKMHGTMQDITELKMAEGELRKYRDRLEELVGERTSALTEANRRLQIEIAERERAEADVIRLNWELESKIRELENINTQLEAFDYSLAHDLSAPLRVIDGFSRMLLKHYFERLDPEGRHFIETIRENSRKMERFISDLLNLARLGRREMTFTGVDMNGLAEAVFEELKAGLAGRAVEFRKKDLPAAAGEPTLLHQVLANLLSNAVKFTAPREKAVIEVGGSFNGRENVYYVKDNGVGFDMAHADRLFGVFKRLHAESEFEGTGAGLAIVKRIIDRHGGRVWAEGKVNEGATFYFTIPERAKKESTRR